LQVNVFNGNSYIPIPNARVTIAVTGQSPLGDIFSTNSSGQTREIELVTPNIENSLTPTGQKPYSLWDVVVEAPGFRTMRINGVQVFPAVLALQQCNMQALAIGCECRQEDHQIIDILPHRLIGDFPPKIPEDLLKPQYYVLGQVVIPEFIVVHDGVPSDTTAADYTVRFRDYIKNVASGEIFSTWPENTIRANVYCILSFTLNRIFTEWYRSKGYNFQITSSTAYDQFFIYGRNIYANISNIVDQIFSSYAKMSYSIQPLLAQYCDGVRVTCPGWFSQWGSKYLGDLGYTPYEMLTYYYGPSLYLSTAIAVSGIPSSFPGYELTIGSTGPNVSKNQTYLNRIAVNYPAIPTLVVDGIFGRNTYNSIRTFQQIFSLTPTGTLNFATWYRISAVYVAVTQMAARAGSEENIKPHNLALKTINYLKD
jgi:peptidoglycan hydrolase-like protein with peptidoglycan-binding domain